MLYILTLILIAVSGFCFGRYIIVPWSEENKYVRAIVAVIAFLTLSTYLSVFVVTLSGL